MGCEEHAPLHTLGNPLLMEDHAGIVGNPQIEQAGSTGDAEIKVVFFAQVNQSVTQLFALLVQKLRQVQPLHLFDAGDAGGHGDCRHPVAAGEVDAGHGALEELLAAEGGDVIAVGQSLAEADHIRLEAEVVVAARQIQTEAGADIIHDQKGLGVGA